MNLLVGVEFTTTSNRYQKIAGKSMTGKFPRFILRLGNIAWPILPDPYNITMTHISSFSHSLYYEIYNEQSWLAPTEISRSHKLPLVFLYNLLYISAGLTIWQKWHMPRASRFWGPRAFRGPALLRAPPLKERAHKSTRPLNARGP